MSQGLVYALMFISTAALTAILIAFLLAKAILMPQRMIDGKAIYLLKRLNPLDLGIAYQEKTFVVEREGERIALATWWMPCGKSEKTVVLIHGRADAKVGAIAWAPTLLRLGVNVLAVDLRAHGQSGGEYSTAGYFERHDLSSLIDQARKEWEGSWDQIFLMGLSMGGAAALATADLRDDIAGVIVDSTFLSWQKITWNYLHMSGYGFVWLHRLAIHMVNWLSGANPALVEPEKTLQTVKCPVLWIMGQSDPLNDDTLGAVAQTRQSQGYPFKAFEISQAGHLEGILKNPYEYEAELGKWMQEC